MWVERKTPLLFFQAKSLAAHISSPLRLDSLPAALESSSAVFSREGIFYLSL